MCFFSSPFLSSYIASSKTVTIWQMGLIFFLCCSEGICVLQVFSFTHTSAFLCIIENLFSTSTERFQGAFVSREMKSNCQMLKEMCITCFSMSADRDLIGSRSIIPATVVLFLLIFWVWFVKMWIFGSRKLNVRWRALQKGPFSCSTTQKWCDFNQK